MMRSVIRPINDNFDTLNQNSVDNDFAGICMWFNEFYACDTSRKVRAVIKAKGERGENLTSFVPYGYVLKRFAEPLDRKSQNYQELSNEFPLFYKYKVLLPCLIVYRIFLRMKEGKLKAELKALKNAKS